MKLFVPLHVWGLAIAPAWLALLALVAIAAGEALWVTLRGRRYDLRDAAANLAMYAGHAAILFFWAPWLFLIYDALHEHALFDLGRDSALYRRAPWALWALLVVGEDFCFYWFHRTSHGVRLLWASHENHHSSLRFNWTVALRQTWTPFSAVIFWLPLPLLGFEPLMVLAAQTASLAYQAFLHTELGGDWPLLKWLLNTPRHHRVHHASDEALLDRNFGGVFIIWDRLFGTFATGVPRAYGVGQSDLSLNPVAVAFREWALLVADLLRSRSLGDVFGYLFRAPGWRPQKDK